MTPAERSAFETEMASDPELEALVYQHRLERIGLELLVERDLRAKMQAWDRETELFQQIRPSRARVRPLVWALRAAAVVTALAVGYWLLHDDTAQPATPEVVQTPSKPKAKTAPTWRKPAPQRTPPADSPANIAQEALPPAPIEEMAPAGTPIDYAAVADDFFRESDFVLPQGSKGGSIAYWEALKNLQEGRLKEVTDAIKPERAPLASSETLLQQELLAVAYYKSQRYADAEMAFRHIAASGKQPYVQRAEWGVVLTLLKQMPQRLAALDSALDVILRQPEHLFHEKAQQLRQRLQR